METMNFDLVGMPDHENEMQEFRLSFVGALPGFRLVRFRIYKREDETAPWILTGEYKYPDLLNKNTISCPILPEWVKTDAKAAICQHITFD